MCDVEKPILNKGLLHKDALKRLSVRFRYKVYLDRSRVEFVLTLSSLLDSLDIYSNSLHNFV